MQRVFCVRFSGDGSYVFSGSDDMNVRVWKAEASEQLGVTLSREKHKTAYNKALVARYKHMPEVRKVVKRRNLPAAIYKVGWLGQDGEAGKGEGVVTEVKVSPGNRGAQASALMSTSIDSCHNCVILYIFVLGSTH